MNPLQSTFVAPHIDWAALAPIVIVFAAAVASVLVEAFVPRAHRRLAQVGLSVVAMGAALVAVVWRWTEVSIQGPQELVAGAIHEDPAGLFGQGLVLVMSFLALLILADKVGGEDFFAPTAAAIPGSQYEEQARRAGLVQTEVYPLTLFAVLGLMVFTVAADLLTMFIALEVLSLPLYLLSGLARRRRLVSQEASLKYFLLGAFSSAFFLMGLALLYGYSGSIRLSEIATAVPQMVGMDGLLLAGSVLVLIGLLFKVAAVPFHSWTPDVYQGAPTPITGFMAAGVKIAAFGAILRFVYVVTPGIQWDLAPFLWTIAILTMIVGTVLALVQTDMKRILAYSAIAHAGFVLLGVISLEQSGIGAVLFYLLAYGLATVGAFGLVAMVRNRNADGTVTSEAGHLSQWAGLGRRSPLLALAMTLFLLSFAGIPLTSGFIGKFTVFSSAIDGGAWPLVVVAIIASAASAFFYIRIIVLMFFTEPAGEHTTVVAPEGMAQVAIAVCAIGTVALGIVPQGVLDLTAQASKFLL
ncbi:NADH-quinone oxidoreductase subunit NuoN [Pseudactinotalea sp. HY160]|uniref:NADH-quinone oxidoreductase subunit NuoN n=1 Tax=Pseudactinotalea sp. HY160 TaxID=2654490 RepID=UPI00128E37BF|nr:NADH-quinone oxidoreductase subunit NuoN [Pseudactinotalea sp. HY160]MPV50513.1 NADH-quinone oxidoreductase subunit NuoN [Pseudactinotalea sp. HY160]